jgi:hypothetical protein
MRCLNILDGWPFGSGMEDDIFSAERNFFSEGVADPVIGKKESLVGDRFVSFKDDSVKVLNFSFGVFGPEKDVFESGDCLAVVDRYFNKQSLVEVRGVEVVNNFEATFEISSVNPGGVIDTKALDEIVELGGAVISECFNDSGKMFGFDTNVIITTVDELFDDVFAELAVDEFEIGSGYFGAHLDLRLGLEFGIGDRRTGRSWVGVHELFRGEGS